MTSNATVPNTADVIWTIGSLACDGGSCVPPLYQNAPLGWGGSVTVLGTVTWRTTQVPWFSTMNMLLPPGDGGAAVTVVVTVPISPCQRLPLGLQYDEGASGATCLVFNWTGSASYEAGYGFQLLTPSGFEVAAGTAPAGATTVTITDVTPETPYVFQLWGMCSEIDQGRTETLTVVSGPAPQLGPEYSTISVVDNGDGTCNIVIEYTDYYCATDFLLPVYANQPTDPAWTGQVTSVGEEETLQWQITKVPYSTNMALILQASASGACTCVPLVGAPLTRTLTVPMPSPPPENCGAVPLTASWVSDESGATCLTFAWTPNAHFAYGYSYQLRNGSTVVQSGTVPNHNTATLQLTGLQPSTAYVLTLTGRCGESTLGTPVTVNASTIAGCSPSLAPFVQSPTNTSFAPVGSGTTYTYTATITYSDYTCVGTPVLSWVASPVAPGAVIAAVNTTTWTVSGIPTGATAQLKFTATPASPGCSSCCIVSSTNPIATAVAITAPLPGNQCSNRTLAAQFVPLASGATCLTFTWTAPSVSNFPLGYTWVLIGPGSVQVAHGSVDATTSTVTISALTPSTPYTFQIQGRCTASTSTSVREATGSTTALLSPSMADFTQTETNPTFSFNSDDTATMTLTYLPSNVTCVTGVTLGWNQTPPAGSVITPTAGGQWHVTNVPVGTDLAMTLSGTGAAATCVSGCNPTGTGTPISTDVSISVPSKPPPPVNSGAAFDLVITHYAGPPARLVSAGSDIEAETKTDPSLQGAGLATAPGSYLNQQSLNQTYATNVVQRFLKHQLQTQRTISGDLPFYMPITAIYYGNVIDPTVQGNCVPHQDSHGAWKVFLAYNYADSSSTINPEVPYANFSYPPFLEFHKQLMVYNWEAQNGVYVNPAQVRIGSNNYGSKQLNQQWFFHATIDPETGIISTTDLSTDPNLYNPETFPSIVDGIPNDGNGSPPVSTTAGWNCMERWFMHAAYCNQQLRKLISDGEIKGAASVAMTLNDLTQTNAQYFQISAITTDAEGNGFPNTLYPDAADTHVPPAYYWADWFPSVTGPQCNITMKTLWDKWMNQSTTLQYGSVGWWTAQAQEGIGMVAPAPRAYMPTTPSPFTLPCAMSMTTPGLLKDMTVADTGSSDFDGVNAIFHEIYDTSDSMPYYFLGANTTPTTDCAAPHASDTGVPFSAAVQTAANPTSASDQFAQYPEQYNATYGTWDNLVLTSYQCPGALMEVGGKLVPDASTEGAMTAFTNSTTASCPLMNTSEFTPWANAVGASSASWILAKQNPPTDDTACLGWALEGSRYDLFNGAWAFAAAGDTNAVDYNAVKQDEAGADGALLWSDLSTGLKPRVASIMKTVTTPAAAAGQVWMLSNQCGPWVNFKGVRASARSTEGPAPQPDWLTFGCPDSAFHGEAWPGWTGMAGQWWGPGTSANAGILQTWSLDQASLGAHDPATSTVTTDSTENNFGVFADFNIQVAAWRAMARDLRGQGLNPNGISNTAGIKFSDDVTGPPQCGCYELAFLPLSWMGPPAP